jgi:hypothetical protein
VEAVDAAGNTSGKAALTTVNTAPDSIAPSDVTGLAGDTVNVHSHDVALSWTAATDNVGVTGYGVYRRQVDPSAATQPAFAKIADVPGTKTAYTDPQLPAGTYEYKVDAVDSAANRSKNLSAAVKVVVANEPPTGPHSILAFPARDFVSSTGYAVSEGPITVSLIRAGTVYTSTQVPVTPDAPGSSTGIVEVNHPGGGCWNGTTPNMRPGDVVRFTNKFGVAEQTTVANVVVDRPLVQTTNPAGGGTVVVHGTAQDAAGNPLPVDQVENRLIANRDAFDLNGRRTVRAGGAGTDGTLSYDAAGSVHWTATYQFTTDADLARATGGTAAGTTFPGAESRVLWLGRVPLALTEMTTYENGAGVAGGPTAGIAGCTSGPAETPAPGAAVTPAAGRSFGSQPANTSPGAQQLVTLASNGTAPLHVDRIYVAGLNPADFAIQAASAGACPAVPFTLAAGASCNIGVAFDPKAVGTRQGNLSVTGDAANTTDLTVPLSGTGFDPAAPSTPTGFAQKLQTGDSVTPDTTTLANSTLPLRLSWNASTGTVDHYEVQESKNGGAFAGLPTLTATSLTRNVAMGSFTAQPTYQYRVRACADVAGTKCSAWATGGKATLLPADDKTLSVVSFGGTWTQNSPLAGAYGGTVAFSTTSGSTATLNKVTFIVPAGSLAWIGTMGPNRGKATVSIDRGPATTVDLYSPTQKTANLVWSVNGLSAGTATQPLQHTVTVTVAGTKNAASTGTRVDLDGFVAIR